MLNAVASNLKSGAENWIWNGGDWGVARFEAGDPEFFALVEAADACPFAFRVNSRELGLVGISHAEPPSRWIGPTIEEEIEKIIWSRKKINSTGRIPAAEGAHYSAHGHCIVEDVVFRNDAKAYWIDLGCFATGRLCALQIAGHEDLRPQPLVVDARP